MQLGERRLRRTNVPEVDLGSWLYAESRRQGLLGIVLANERGQLVGASLPRDFAKDIAETTPFLAEITHRSMTHYWRRFKLSVMAVIIGGQLYYLVAVGQGEFHPESVRGAEPGVRRILMN